MDLAGKYEKTNLIGEGEIQVWGGRDKARGTQVLLHIFTSNPRVLGLAVEYLLKRPPNSLLLDIGELSGATCLVTAHDLEVLDVTAWLEGAILPGRSVSGAQPLPASGYPGPERRGGDRRVDTTGPVPIPRADSGPVSKPAPDRAPGEFTRAFQIPSSSAPSPRLDDPLASSGPNKASAKPGEFTQLFQVPGQPGNRPSVKTPDLGLPPSPPDTRTPSIPPSAPSGGYSAGPSATPSAGEFTRLFRPPALAPGSPWAQPNESPSRDFLPPKAPPSPEVPVEPAPPKMSIASGPVSLPERSAPPVPKGPGEYTRIIQTPPQTGSPQAPSQTPGSQSPGLAQAVQIQPPTFTPPTLPSTPSFQSPSVPQAQVSFSPPQAPQVQVSAPSGSRPGLSPIIFLFGGLILVALILVLVFALRK
jgi:hypothetical protein